MSQHAPDQELSADVIRIGGGKEQRVIAREDPTVVEFSTADNRDTFVAAEVTLTNASPGSETTDLTVVRQRVFGGNVTEEMSSTRSVSLAGDETRTIRFDGPRERLDHARYRLRVDLPSSASLALTQSSVLLQPWTISLVRRRDGTTAIRDQEGRAQLLFPAGSPGVRFAGPITDQQGTMLTDFAGTGLDAADGVLSTTGLSSTVTVSGTGNATVVLPHDLGETPSQVFPVARSADAAGVFHVSSRSAEDVTLTYETAPPSGTDNLEYDLMVEP